MTVSDQIIEVLNALCEKFGIALDWGNENIIPYVTTLGEKLVNYGIWSSAAWIVICAIATIICIATLKGKTMEALYDDDDFIGDILYIVVCCVGLFAIAGVIGNTFEIIKCLTFPELYIFEYIQGLINSGS